MAGIIFLLGLICFFLRILLLHRMIPEVGLMCAFLVIAILYLIFCIILTIKERGKI